MRLSDYLIFLYLFPIFTSLQITVSQPWNLSLYFWNLLLIWRTKSIFYFNLLSKHKRNLVNSSAWFCQGRQPRIKYIITYPIDYMSSRRDCYTPAWLLILAYRGVPIIYLPYLNSICWPSFIYLFEILKSKT